MSSPITTEKTQKEMISGITQESVCHYELKFDLDDENNQIDGLIKIFDDTIIKYKDGIEVEKVFIGEATEFVATKHIGGGSFSLKSCQGDKLVCKFTMRNFAQFAELAKALNHQRKYGDYIKLDIDQAICPKCGKPLLGNKQCSYCIGKGKILVRFLKMFKKFYPLMALSVCTTLLAQGCWMLLPYLDRLLIDNYIMPQSNKWGEFALVGASMIGVHVFMTLIYRVNARFTNKASNGIGKELRSMVFSKIQSLSMTSISKKSSGELINRITQDTTRIQDFVADFGPELILRVISFIVLLIIIIVTDVKLALIVLLPIPIVFYIVTKLQERVHIYYLNFWRKGAKANSILHDILSGIRVVKCFGSEKREIEKYNKVSEDYTASLQRAELYWCKRFPFIDFFITIGQYFLMYFGSNLILQEQMTVGQLIQLSTYVSMIYIPIRWMMHIRRQLSNVGVSASKILEVLDENEQIVDIDKNESVEIKGDVEFKNVFFSYKKYESVLKDISFKVNKGEMIGIVGHSGVGKSTLINLILHLYDVTDGEILVDGKNINDIPQISLRSEIGVVLQETFLFYGTVYENIKYSKPDATFEEVMEAAKIANAHQFIINLPDGYNTRVGEKGHSLSGGERQRIAIARAILHDPSILILDEATASLDTKTEKEIQEALARLIKGRTTFAIAHRLSTLREANRLLVLDKGEVAEIGTHKQLMLNKSVYYDLVMAQRQTAKIKK